MKVAGRKNDGAWFRTNKMIASLVEPDQQALANWIAESAFITAAFTAIDSLATELNLTDIPRAGNIDEWARQFVDSGIPRQIWHGKLSWTTYSDDGAGGFIANYQSPMHYFAKDLRKRCKEFFMGRRQVVDIMTNRSRALGNVGGLPDADKDT